MKRYVSLLSLCLAAQAAVAASSLCTRGEVHYFSCRTGAGPIISLCGDVDANEPWLQYRFGRPGANELVFPQSKTDSVKRFTPQRIRAGGGAYGVDAIAFVSGGVGYSVDDVTPESGDSWQGVSVGDPRDFDLERGARRPAKYPRARIVCTEGGHTAKFGELIDLLGNP
jgi:hypothetical protein